LVIVLVCAAPAVRALEKVGAEVEVGLGPVWAETGFCQYYGCPVAFGVSARVGYAFATFASLGIRAGAALGPEGSEMVCGGGTPTCPFAEGHRATSILLDGQLHTLGWIQLVGGLGFGVGHLIRLQCNCSEQSARHGSGIPALELAVGVRAYLVPDTLHIGVAGKYAAMFNVESLDIMKTPPTPVTGITVSTVGLVFSVGASL
jgi:hypothetical protein